MAGLFGSITIKGNRLTEFAAQTSTVGIPIPFGFGKFPCEGNIIFAPMPPKEHVKKKKQGKGGVKTEEYSYTLSYAIAFCEGPIFGYWTIKRNGKVVWTQDPNATVEDRAYAAKWAQKATFYYGTETQLPDSTIESYKGAGKVSGHRGIAYIVVEDDDVTDNGGAVPTYEAVVIASPPDIFVTSLPYPALEIESAEFDVSATGGELRTLLHERWEFEAAQFQIAPNTGEMRDVYIKRYIEEAGQFEIAASGGALKSVQQNADSQDSAAQFTVSASSGLLKNALIPADSQDSAAQFTITPSGGSLQ